VDRSQLCRLFWPVKNGQNNELFPKLASSTANFIRIQPDTAIHAGYVGSEISAKK
jgi:hypothetical protein